MLIWIAEPLESQPIMKIEFREFFRRTSLGLLVLKNGFVLVSCCIEKNGALALAMALLLF